MISKSKKSQYEITQLIGQDDAKIKMLKDPFCPPEYLSSILDLLYNKNDVLTDQDLDFAYLIAKHNAISRESILRLEEIAKKTKDALLLKHVHSNLNHPYFQKKFLFKLDQFSNYQLEFNNIVQMNKPLSNLLIQNCFLSGNSISAILNDHGYYDYDFFFKTIESAQAFFEYVLSLDNKLQKYKIITHKNGLIIEGLTKPIEFIKFGYNIYITKNAITFTNKSHLKLQFITRKIGDPNKVTANFDFSHCSMYIDLAKREFVFSPQAIFSSKTKFLIINNNIENPLNALIRLRKFLTRGFHINSCELVKLGYQINKLNLCQSEQIEEAFSDYYGEQLTEFFKKDFKGINNINYEDIVDFSYHFYDNDFYDKK